LFRLESYLELKALMNVYRRISCPVVSKVVEFEVPAILGNNFSLF
jgi:hypothetical protein